MATTRRELREKRLHLRMGSTERQALRDLAAEENRTDSELVRDLVREAIAAKRAAQREHWGPRLFGTAAGTPDEAV